jgi:archaeal type IV pilus assembly protein PilA
MKQNHDAVSPVVAVMLMLVVTIIIAAIVSAFAGNTLSGSQKTPTATIQATFSQSNGMQIIQTGGDSVPAANTYFTMIAGPTFGLGIEAVATDVLNKTTLRDVNGNRLFNPDGTTNMTSFSTGTVVYVPRESIDCTYLQPSIAPIKGGTDYWDGTHWRYDGTKKGMWAVCYGNPDNIGKTFTLQMADKATGAVIAKTVVVIAP